MTVRDTGSGFPVEHYRNGTGVGIGNTAARLEELYGIDQEFTRENGPDGGALVTIAIPYTVLPRLTQEEVEWRRSAL
jgi:two-component system, LytTR family, sensor kinase